MTFIAFKDLLLQAPATRIAVFDEGRAVSWGTIIGRIQSLAAILEKDKRNQCALHCDSGLEFVVGLLGALLAKKSVVLPVNAQPDTLASLCGLSLLTDGAPGYPETIRPCAAPPSSFPLAELDDRRPALELYTSGSTGQPKRILKSLFNLTREAQELESVWGMCCRDACIVSTVSHQHIYGLLFKIFWPLCSGKPFLSRAVFYPEELTGTLRHLKQRPALISSPALLKRLPGHPGIQELASVPCAIFSSGGPLPSSAGRELVEREATLFEILGSTETGGIAWRKTPDEWWQPFKCVSVSMEKNGILGVSSPYLFGGGSYLTEDVVTFGEDGRFRHLGRNDRTAKIEEKRVNLDAIEEHLKKSGLVQDAYVMELDRNPRRSCLAALIVPAHPAPRKNEFHAKMRSYLLGYYEPVTIPKVWRFIPVIPANAQGKRNAAQLAALFSRDIPEITSLAIGPECSATLVIPEDLPFFEGHFPAHPIVPGFIQIHWAETFARALVSPVYHGSRVKSGKFIQPVRPLDVLTLTLRPEAKRCLYLYERNGEAVSSGTLMPAGALR